MTLIFLGNAGVYLSGGSDGILVDAPNGRYTVFDPVADVLMEPIAAGHPPYDTLRGLCFTHQHSDHYNRKRVRELLERRPDLAVFVPNGATPETGEVAMGNAVVRYFTAPHSGAELRGTIHRVLLATVGGKTVYLSGDADWMDPIHKRILGTYRPDAAVWNGNYVSHEEGRRLLALCPKNFICHLPVLVEDKFGIGKKCQTSLERYAEELKTVTPVWTYPTEAEI